MNKGRSNRFWAEIIAALCSMTALIHAQADLQFNRDIRPIFTENCFQCHGPDPGSRKADLRLDTRQGIYEKGPERGAAVLPGKAAESPLYQRITNKDPDEVMPPPKSHKVLSAEQIELVRKWIDQGAVWQPHWALIKPVRPQVPEVKAPELEAWGKNPIDAFVLQNLRAHGLAPSPEAERRTLARRMALDLTGLPPSPQQVEAFVEDAAPDFVEKFAATLMALPSWGEHRARYWLDAARYADTHGLHFDNYREIWPYRDWVIKAFNKNQPFDQFVLEQVAGDLLPSPTLDQVVATGFHRCGVSTNEGGTIPEENLAMYARDRVETTGWVFLGLTANCAVCHDHKFDPITTKEFYAMSAYFRNTEQGAMDGNDKGPAPSIPVPSGSDRERWEAISKEISALKAQQEQRKNDVLPEFEKWITSMSSADIAAYAPQEGLVAYIPLTEGEGTEVTAHVGPLVKLKSPNPIEWKPDGKVGPAPVFKPGVSFELGQYGDFETDQAFSYGGWVKCGRDGVYGGIIARMDQKKDFRGWDLYQSDRNFSVHLVNQWPQNALKMTTRDNPIKVGQWQHVFVTYDGTAKAEGVRLYVDGAEVPLRVDVQSLKDTIRTDVPLMLGQRSVGEFFDGGSMQDIRIYKRRLDPAEIQTLSQTGLLHALLAGSQGSGKDQRAALLHFFLTTKDEPSREAIKKVAELESESQAILGRSPVTLIQKERADATPKARVLHRGQYDQPGDEVEPAVFSALHSLPEGAPKNRLGLAQWLVSPENPLLARVTINRLWQEIFGTGLVKTSEDFGIMGEAPANQQLLDWLAVEFRESGWDVKHMVSLIVSSQTYRQSAVATKDKLEKDPQNRLFSRGPRFRLDAEMVRDFALQTSGLLVAKIGGPSVKPYQPEGVWEAVAMRESNTRNYKQDEGENLYRRSLYTFWKRSAPPASMDILNAPSREVSCARRERTNTPLQAMLTLNDVQFIEASRALGQAAFLAGSGDADKGIEFLALRILSRPLKENEMAIIKATLMDLSTQYGSHEEEAKKLISVGATKPDPGIHPVALASWTMVANQMLNLDEALNK